MNEFYTRNVLEAALLAAGKPLQIAEMGQLFEESTRPKVDDIRATLDALAAEYSNRGLEVKETAAGFRIQVRREFASEISRLWPERPARYSRALLETLALIAYRQPITRAEIEAVRGVAVNPNIVKTVIERNWVRVVGHRDVPGRPELLGTTREFLDYFGLRSLDELPPLAELKAMGDYNLQLELPNAGALGVEKVDGEIEVEGTDGVAVTVSGLLTSEAAVAEGTAEVAEVAAGAADTGASREAVGDAAADADATVGVETAHGAAAPHAAVDGEVAHSTAAPHAAVGANGAGGEGSHDAVADVAGMRDEDGHRAAAADGDADANGVSAEDSRDAVTAVAGMRDEDGQHAAAADAADAADANGVDSEGFHDAVADVAGMRDDEDAHYAAANASGDVEGEASHDAEADRTLSAVSSSKHAAEADESETSEGTITSESLDALDDAAEDDSDEDELSADGHGSRELVAAPRDIDD
jgi:segregation and condensation protein B